MIRPFGSPVLKLAIRFLLPPMLLFALYVVWHGHDSPGGGFQGGTLLGTALIVARLVLGNELKWGIGRRTALLLAAAGLTLYAGIGVAALLSGGNYLNYGNLPLPVSPLARRWIGIMGIEVGVAVGVTGVFFLLFDRLTEPEK